MTEAMQGEAVPVYAIGTAIEKAHDEYRATHGITGFARDALPLMAQAAMQAIRGEAVSECLGCNVLTTRPDGGEIKWCCYCGRPTEDYNNE
jgi:hypothetical protein